MQPINLKEKFSKFSAQWHPHQIATVDDMQVILAKIQGEFVWHAHKDEDELFYVQKGTLEMHFRKNATEKSKAIEWMEVVNEGEIIVVPKGVEHCPKSRNEEEVHLLLFEKKTTAHTGKVSHEKTKTHYPKI